MVETDKQKEMVTIGNCEKCGLDLRYVYQPIHRIINLWYCDKCYQKYILKKENEK